MMKFYKLFFILLAVVVFSCSKEVDTIDDLVKYNIDAHGGESKLRDIKTLEIDMKIVFMGMENKMKMYIKNPDKYLTMIESGDVKQSTVLNGKKGWICKNNDTVEMTPEQVEMNIEQVKSQTGFFNNNLLDYLDKKIDATLIGKDTADGKNVFKISLKKTINNQPVEIIQLIDAETYLTHKSMMKQSMMGEEMTIENYMLDYKEVEGIQIPHKIEIRLKGELMISIVFDKVLINNKIDDGLFEKK